MDLLYEICSQTKFLENMNELFFKINNYEDEENLKEEKEESNFFYFNLNEILPMVENSKENYKGLIYAQKVDLNIKILQALNSMIESLDDKTKNVMVDKIEWKKMLNISSINLFKYFEARKWTKIIKKGNDSLIKKVTTSLNNQEFERHFLEIISLLINIRSIENYGTVSSLNKDLYFYLSSLNNDEQKDNYSRISFVLNKVEKYFVKSIEIIDEEKLLKKVYFPKLIMCNDLNQKTKDQIIKDLDRTSYDTKIAEFFAAKSLMNLKIDEAYTRKRISYLSMIKYLIFNLIKFLHFILIFFIAYLIGIEDNKDKIHEIKFNGEWTDIAYSVCIIVQIPISIFIFLIFLFSKENYYEYVLRWEKFNREMAKEMGRITQDEIFIWAKNPDFIEDYDLKKVLFVEGPFHELLTLNYSEIQQKIIKLNFKKMLFSIYIFLKSFKIFLHFIDSLFCLLTLHHPVFATFLLLIFMLRFPIVQGVVLSFYKNWKEFTITIIFGLTILLTYSSIAFYFLKVKDLKKKII